MTKLWGITEMPLGERARDYPDMLSEKLTGAIEAEGVRLAWSCAAHCPCAGLNPDTSQPNPNCTRCRGIGTIFFGPPSYVPAEAVGELDDVQKAILAVDGAAVIRGVMGRFARGMTHEETFYDVIGRWRSGEALVTVRPENRLGYMDRLVNLDATIVHSEILTVQPDVVEIPLRYRATDIQFMTTESTLLLNDVDFRLDAGQLSWLAGSVPAVETVISVRYWTHPTWRVMDMPHSTREITRRYPKPLTGPKTPHGRPVDLPIAAVVALEMLPVKEG